MFRDTSVWWLPGARRFERTPPNPDTFGLDHDDGAGGEPCRARSERRRRDHPIDRAADDRLCGGELSSIGPDGRAAVAVTVTDRRRTRRLGSAQVRSLAARAVSPLRWIVYSAVSGEET
jgi:hypothetical protein